jgi:UDP-N-acetylglucosamine transferase subunit ALG13
MATNRNLTTKTLFVTVGSTKFEKLINKILKPDILNLLKSFNFKKIILQVGSGVHEDDELFNFKEKNAFSSTSNNEMVKFFKENVEINAYRYKSSIKEDMQKADLVISHAGSGSVLESLEANKKLIVVVNDALMDNHQLELAEKMFDEGYLLYTNCDGLADKIELINNQEFKLKNYVPGNPRYFGNFLKNLMSN